MHKCTKRFDFFLGIVEKILLFTKRTNGGEKLCVQPCRFGLHPKNRVYNRVGLGSIGDGHVHRCPGWGIY
jgi:hypothetical protein